MSVITRTIVFPSVEFWSCKLEIDGKKGIFYHIMDSGCVFTGYQILNCDEKY